MHRRLRTLHDAIDWSRRRLFAFLLRPETRVGQVLQHAVAHQIDLLRRKSGLRRLRSWQFRMPRIAVDVDAFVEDLLAEFRFAARRENGLRPSSALRASKLKAKNPSRSATACGSRIAGYTPGSSTRGLRASSALRIASPATRGVEFRNVEVIAKKVTGAGSVGCSGRCR